MGIHEYVLNEHLIACLLFPRIYSTFILGQSKLEVDCHYSTERLAEQSRTTHAKHWYFPE